MLITASLPVNLLKKFGITVYRFIGNLEKLGAV